MNLTKTTRMIIQRDADSKQIHQMRHQLVHKYFENAIENVI
jgi:hypothetical protein